MSAGPQRTAVWQRSGQQGGYVLLGLLLIMALLVITAAIIVPTIAFDIKRDREEELIHRGVQYSRAIRAYAKRTGRFPTQMQDLRDPNGVKFLRKIYKDPITGRDFKLLHMTDISALAAKSNPSLNQSTGDTSATPGDTTSVASPDSNANSLGDAATQPGTGTQPAAPFTVNGDVNTNSFAARPAPNSTDVPSNLLIFGVASTSKDPSIREFNHKNHYNDWLFFYDPRYDTGYHITGPTSQTIPQHTLQPGASSQGLNPAPPNQPSAPSPAQPGVPQQ
jgi:type II secretory pathway pseudopilin PulG